MKIRPVGANLLHADGRTSRRADRRTDMTRPTVVFRNFANAPPPKKNKKARHCVALLCSQQSFGENRPALSKAEM